MTVMAVPVNKMHVIKAEDAPKFFEEFNKNIPSKEFWDSCREVGKLFERDENK